MINYKKTKNFFAYLFNKINKKKNIKHNNYDSKTKTIIKMKYSFHTLYNNLNDNTI